jgi:hypothetical protein
MPLLGSAAMLLSFDVEADAVDDHDRWHTHEHLPERLAIPGFLRGTRWIASEGSPRYMVVYEVESLATLASPAYLERLNQPTPWTARTMPRYRGMRRGLCSVVGSFGLGQGGFAALLTFAATEPQAGRIRQWLLDDVLPALAATPGLGSAHLLHGAQQAAMTDEQRIRGADRGIDSAIVVTGYDGEAVAANGRALLERGGLADKGAAEIGVAVYRCAYSLSASEVAA